MANRLRGLRVHEISLVDAPANKGAVHLLFKRKDASMPKLKDTALDRLLAKLGLAKRTEVDLGGYADAASASVDTATDTLKTALDSILADAAVIDKSAAIATSLAQFRTHLGTEMPAHIEKAMRDVALVSTSLEKDDTMPTPAEQIEALTKLLADKEAELLKAKAAPPDDADAAAEADAKAKKAKAAADAKANPFGKSEEGVALAKALVDMSDLQKRIAVYDAEREMEAFKKRALAIGLGDSHAEMLLKASKGEPESFGKILDLVKSATAAAKVGGVFKEFGGTGSGADASAAGEVAAKAEVLMKADPKLGVIAARVAVRKANQDLAQRERDEERAAARQSA